MNFAIIVAAGQGTRMGGTLSKQYLPIGGVPILRRTLDVFIQSGHFPKIVVVAATADMVYCRRQILAEIAPGPALHLIAGGGERQESVFNGLAAIDGQDEDVVLIHDGVRPFLPLAVLTNCLDGTQTHGACIAAVQASDTLKRVDAGGRIVQTLPRATIWQAQTPQGFRLGLIRQAHQRARDEGFRCTDDAQLVERLGHRVAVVPGSRRNIKVTTPEDLPLAEAIWRHGRRSSETP